MLGGWLSQPSLAQCPCSNPGAYQACNGFSNATPDYVQDVPGLTFKMLSSVPYSRAPLYGETMLSVGGQCLPGNPKCMGLSMDIYLPCNQQNNRPAVILASGGGFENNNRCNPKIQFLAKQLVRKGYVVAAIEYRRFKFSAPWLANGQLPFQAYIDSIADTSAVRAEEAMLEMMYKVKQDGTSAVQYLRANAAALKINPHGIFIGGLSAGASVALHAAYMDQSDFPMNWPGYSKWGRMTAFSRYPNCSYRVRGVLDFWGAISKLPYLDSQEANLFIAHGTWDPRVHFQFSSAMDGLFGAEPLATEAIRQGIPTWLYSICKGKHALIKTTPGLTCNSHPKSLDVNDSIISKASRFMAESIQLTLPLVTIEKSNPAIFAFPNKVMGNMNLVEPPLVNAQGISKAKHCPSQFHHLSQGSFGKTGPITVVAVEPEVQPAAELLVYPNPVEDGALLWVETDGPVEAIELVDVTGRAWAASIQSRSGDRVAIALDEVPGGLYFLRVSAAGRAVVKQVVKL
ncbi:MAG: T9SS type A sorting domain-containing protein [Bacteroidota bacterium]